MKILLLFLIFLFNNIKFSISGTCSPSTFSGFPLTAVSPEGKCYTVLSSRNYNSAANTCDSIGMRIAVVNGWSENQFIVNNLQFTQAWIGLADFTEGTWRWYWGGQVTQYTNWASGEPNNKDNEDCAQIIKSTGKWNDEDCGNSYQTLCAICSTGTYFDGRVCAGCPAGTFSSSLSRATSCTRCAAGYFSALGATSCTICPRGTYSNTDNTACVACPAGSVSNVGSSSINQCTPCQDGYYVNNTYCVTCAPIGALPARFTGGGASKDDCKCKSPWVGAKCDIDQCSSRLNGLSLGGLYLQSLPELKNYSKTFSTATSETYQDVRDLLKDIFYGSVDLDGDERITKDEMLTSLRSKGILNASLTSLPLWCPTYNAQTCITSTYSSDSFIKDSFNNYITTASHEFDSSNLPILSSFTATFPNPSWTDSDCSTRRNTNVAVGWTFISNRPALYRVCGYTNGFVDPSFGTAAVVSGSVTSFTDISPITKK